MITVSYENDTIYQVFRQNTKICVTTSEYQIPHTALFDEIRPIRFSIVQHEKSLLIVLFFFHKCSILNKLLHFYNHFLFTTNFVQI